MSRTFTCEECGESRWDNVVECPTCAEIENLSSCCSAEMDFDYGLCKCCHDHAFSLKQEKEMRNEISKT